MISNPGTWSRQSESAQKISTPSTEQARRQTEVTSPVQSPGSVDSVDKNKQLSTPELIPSKTNKQEPKDQERNIGVKREQWGTEWSFLMSSISFVVGLGNVWRFPTLAYENGGVAFLMPYGLAVILVGLPGVYFEFLLGQSMQTSPVGFFRKMTPFFQGLGWTMSLVSIGMSISYNVMIAWALLYIVESLRIPFTGTYAWSACNNTWNNRKCVSFVDNQHCEKFSNGNLSFAWHGGCIANQTIFLQKAQINSMKESQSATEQYFENYIVQSSIGFEDIGYFNWKVFVSLGFVWFVTCLATMFGIKYMGYAAHVTTIVPAILIGDHLYSDQALKASSTICQQFWSLVVLFGLILTLPGAMAGVRNLFDQTDFSKLLHLKAWAGAIGQVFYSLSIGIIGLSDLASYNDRNYNCFRDAAIVVIFDVLISLLAGINGFAILGFMAKATNQAIPNVLRDAQNLAFAAYPEATTMMPALGWVFALMFFVMVVLMGIGTQFELVMLVVTSIADHFPEAFSGRPKVVVAPIVCLFGFVCGIGFCFGNGKEWFGLLDTFTTVLSSPLCSSIMFLIVCYIYGIRRFLRDVKAIFGEPRSNFTRWIIGTQSYYFVICWLCVTPIIGISLFSYNFVMTFISTDNIDVDNKSPRPTWVYMICGFIFVIEFLPLFGFAAVNTILACIRGKTADQEDASNLESSLIGKEHSKMDGQIK